jgi:hypothetical protein
LCMVTVACVNIKDSCFPYTETGHAVEPPSEKPSYNSYLPVAR